MRSSTGLRFVLLALTSLAIVPFASAADSRLLCETAAAGSRPGGAPPLGAVCFSSRWKHPSDAKDPFDTFQAAAAFHATDFVWVYSLDKQFVGRIKQSGARASLAVNSMVTDSPDSPLRRRGRLLDLDGNLLSAPWMRTWKENAWGCANSPEYRASFVAYACKAVDAGAETLQMDDPAMNIAAVNWGGCFCEHCMAGFRAYLKKHVNAAELSAAGVADVERFDYRQHLRAAKAPVGDAFAKYNGGALKRWFAEFQNNSTREFFAETRARIDAHAGRHIVFSSNNYAGRWTSPYDVFEFGIAELPQRDANPKAIHQKFSEARRLGKAQLFTLVPKAMDGSEIGPTRRVIAGCQASGGHMIVPWDVFTGSNKPRYFGKPEHYADLYKFVRDNARWFDGHEDAAYLIAGLPDDRFPTDPPMAVSDPGVVALARAVPGKPDAPVVVHLVDWRDDPRPTTLTLAPRRFVRQGELKAQLLQPGKPAARLEGRASGERIALEIPRLDPWGLVIVGCGDAVK